MKNILTMSVTKISAFLNGFEADGINKEKTLKLACIDPSIFKSPDNRLTSNEVNRLIQEAVRLTNNENIGLCQGELLSKGFSNILGYIMMNCRTLGEAAEKYCKYEKIVDETAITDVKREGGFAILSNVTIDNVLAAANTLSIVTLLSIAKPPSLLTSVMAVSSTIFSYLQYFSAASPRVRQFIIIYPRIFEKPFDKSSPWQRPMFSLLVSLTASCISRLTSLDVNLLSGDFKIEGSIQANFKVFSLLIPSASKPFKNAEILVTDIVNMLFISKPPKYSLLRFFAKCQYFFVNCH